MHYSCTVFTYNYCLSLITNRLSLEMLVCFITTNIENLGATISMLF